jgi:hypothetical protein
MLPSVVVDYYSRMRQQRVYPLVVRWGKDERPASADSSPVVVRPLVPGALVVPAEMNLDPREAAAEAAFQVTPLARGRLNAASIEVQHQGRQLDSIPLRILVPHRRLAWTLLILAFLVPWILWQITGKNELKTDKITYASEEEKKAKKSGETRLMKPGEALADRLNLGKGNWLGVTDRVTDAIGAGYQRVCDAVKDIPQLPLYIGAGLLILAFLSWLTSPLSRRARERGSPLALPRAAG